MIYSVAYRSVPVCDDAHPDADIRRILQQSRENNTARAITGGLLISDGHFVQVLEGERSEVDALMDRIERDPRHTQVHIFFREVRDERRFGTWAMAWIGEGLDAILALPFADPSAVPAWLELLAERAR